MAQQSQEKTIRPEQETIPIGPRWFEQFRSFQSSAFRLEVLQAYAEPSEAQHLNSFLSGNAVPENWIDDWCDLVRQHIKAGHSMTRVHVVQLPLSPYMQFEIECAYTYTAKAGENILLLDHAKVPRELLGSLREDFWLFDDTKVMIQDYTPAGTLHQARILRRPVDVARYLQIRDEVFSRAVPFREFYSSATGRAL